MQLNIILQSFVNAIFGRYNYKTNGFSDSGQNLEKLIKYTCDINVSQKKLQTELLPSIIGN